MFYAHVITCIYSFASNSASYFCSLPVAKAVQRGAPKINAAYYTFASYVRRGGHLYEVFLLLAKMRLI